MLYISFGESLSVADDCIRKIEALNLSLEIDAKTLARFARLSLVVIPMNNLKIKYKKLYEEVRIISNTYDLMGLIKSGAPEDEYDPETSEILPLIDKVKNPDELAAKISDIYNKMFDTDFLPSDEWLSKMATDIYKLKEKKV